MLGLERIVITYDTANPKPLPPNLQSLFVLGLERIVITYDTARLGAIFFVGERVVCNVRQLRPQLLDIEDVGIRVHVVEPIRVLLQNLGRSNDALQRNVGIRDEWWGLGPRLEGVAGGMRRHETWRTVQNRGCGGECP